MYDVGVKLFSRIKSMYDDSSVCVSVKEDKSEHFRIESMVMTWFYVASWRRI